MVKWTVLSHMSRQKEWLSTTKQRQQALQRSWSWSTTEKNKSGNAAIIYGRSKRKYSSAAPCQSGNWGFRNLDKAVAVYICPAFFFPSASKIELPFISKSWRKCKQSTFIGMQITNPDAMMFAWSRKNKGLPGSQAITFDVIAGKGFWSGCENKMWRAPWALLLQWSSDFCRERAAFHPPQPDRHMALLRWHQPVGERSVPGGFHVFVCVPAMPRRTSSSTSQILFLQSGD